MLPRTAGCKDQQSQKSLSGSPQLHVVSREQTLLSAYTHHHVFYNKKRSKVKILLGSVFVCLLWLFKVKPHLKHLKEKKKRYLMNMLTKKSFLLYTVYKRLFNNNINVQSDFLKKTKTFFSIFKTWVFLFFFLKVFISSVRALYKWSIFVTNFVGHIFLSSRFSFAFSSDCSELTTCHILFLYSFN